MPKAFIKRYTHDLTSDELGKLFTRETPEAYRLSGTLAGHYSDEVTQRAQLRWWAARLSRP